MNSQLHLDTGAAALDALSAEEAEAFQEHLVDCAPCAIEYSELIETAALVGAAVAERAPETLHRSLMRLIDVTPQLPPTVRPDVDGVESGRSKAEGHRPWFRRPQALLAAAIAVLALVAGGIAIAVRATNQPELMAEQCVQQAPDARVVEPTVGVGGSVRFAPSCGAAIVTTPTMPGLPEERSYQLWVMADQSADPAGLIPVGVPTSGVVVTVQPEAIAVGVSVEPAGGSPAPTSDPIWVVPLSG